MIKFHISSVCSAFDNETVGSKVVLEKVFLAALAEAVRKHDVTKDRAVGQHFVAMDDKFLETVSAGIAPRSANRDDFVIRSHRGRVESFMRRELAAPVESLAVIVYTRDAYNADPEVKETVGENFSHVIVAVLAGAGPAPALSPYRLVSNLAGGNREVVSWTMDDVAAKSKASKEYDDNWCVVAD